MVIKLEKIYLQWLEHSIITLILAQVLIMYLFIQLPQEIIALN